MQDPYQEQTYQEPTHNEYYDKPRKGMSGWLIALLIILALIVICCLCVCASSLLLGPTMGNTFSVIIEDIATPIP